MDNLFLCRILTNISDIFIPATIASRLINASAAHMSALFFSSVAFSILFLWNLPSQIIKTYAPESIL